MSELEIQLIKYNKKTWCKSALLGFFIGLAVIVPGISGSTVAIIFKLYDQFLYALGNLFKRFKKCFAFLLPIAVGVVVGVALGFFAVERLLEWLPFAIVCLFAGLMSGAFPAVKDELAGAEKTALRITLFIVGLLVPVALGAVSALSTLESQAAGADVFLEVTGWKVGAAFFVGAVMATTQIVPGLSASAFLMAIGWFHSVVDSVSFSYWQSNPAVFLIYLGLGAGFLAGLLGLSKLLTDIFARARHTAYSLIVGLSLGSIFSMFCNGDIIGVYVAWAQGGNFVFDLLLGVALFALGAFGAYKLVQFERKKKE